MANTKAVSMNVFGHRCLLVKVFQVPEQSTGKHRYQEAVSFFFTCEIFQDLVRKRFVDVIRHLEIGIFFFNNPNGRFFSVAA